MVISHTNHVRLKLRTASAAECAMAPPGWTSPAAIDGTANIRSGSGTMARNPMSWSTTDAMIPVMPAVA